MIQDIHGTETKREALEGCYHSIDSFGAKYPRAVERAERDKDAMLDFCDFLRSTSPLICSTNVIETVFATVRLRTYRIKGCG